MIIKMLIQKKKRHVPNGKLGIAWHPGFRCNHGVPPINLEGRNSPRQAVATRLFTEESSSCRENLPHAPYD